MTTDAMTPQEWVDADDGIKRRVLAHSPEAMTVEVAFDAGAVGQPHSHPHVQTTFVLKGSFEFIVDGTKHQLAAGDSIVVSPNQTHGCVALEAGTLIDSFAPRRDDFL